MEHWYKADLAYIHDVGFADYALNAAPGLLRLLQDHHIHSGLITDLGCGSGLWANVLVQAGYQVHGIDISAAMIEIARRRVPSATFVVQSLFQADLPASAAVTAIGECLNYLFDSENCDGRRPVGDHRRQHQLFTQVYAVLPPGGLFIFDIVQPGQVPPCETVRSFSKGADWFVLVEKYENLDQQKLTRHITTFRQVGDLYRRQDEVHEQRLLQAEAVAQILTQVGFEVQIMDRYGDYRLPIARAALIACKTA